MRPVGIDRDRRAEMRQQLLGVIAARLRLDHRGLARRREPRQQHGGFDLGRRNGGAVDDRDRIARAFDGHRQQAAIRRRSGPRPHQRNRIEDAFHWPLA
jgi:hypothetical protein